MTEDRPSIVCTRHSARRLRLPVLVGLALAAATGLGSPAPAVGATFPFALLIQDGGQFTLYARPDGLYVWVSSGHPIFAVVNGQKSGAAIGTAVIYAWQFPVPATFTGSFGALAGLGILRFDAPFSFTVHLGLVQTPAGDLLTTLAAGSPQGLSGVVDETVRGSWLLGNGTSVVGGTAQDLVIAGLWVSNTPMPLSQDTLMTNALVLPSDNTPFTRQVITPSCDLPLCVDGGVFHAQAPAKGSSVPIRAFTAESIFGKGTDEHGHLLMIHAGGGDYAVVACSASQGSFWNANLPIGEPYEGCTLSGTGSLADLSGSVDYCCGGGFPGPVTLTIASFRVDP
jgi:hypothetical protein